ncbi:hypothetical protein CK203_085331 [Vitis vinifera]|uniref:Uncharacterized protein n=1 Tax=Vitis vinifera TaxID=29760 RepID=A0A438DCZ2_VITVI|nr:hypothetical protein CK203_085331 [Vitis vinifera]
MGGSHQMGRVTAKGSHAADLLYIVWVECGLEAMLLIYLLLFETQSSRLQRRHCWVLITLLSLAFQSVRGAEGEADGLGHGGGGSGFASGGANQSGTNENSSMGDGVREFFSRWTRH